MFFYDGKLYRKRKIITSSQSLVAWCYQDQDYAWLPLSLAKRTHKKAYTVSQAAALINISPKRVTELFKQGLAKQPEKSYDYLKGTFNPGRVYISQDDMLDLRQAAWDVLRKNRFGEPYDDTMISEIELEHRMKIGDDRQFIRDEDGEIIKIYQA